MKKRSDRAKIRMKYLHTFQSWEEIMQERRCSGMTLKMEDLRLESHGLNAMIIIEQSMHRVR